MELNILEYHCLHFTKTYNYDTDLYEICVIVASSFVTFSFLSLQDITEWNHVLVDH